VERNYGAIAANGNSGMKRNYFNNFGAFEHVNVMGRSHQHAL